MTDWSCIVPDVPSWVLFLASTVCGGVASYFGAVVAMRERLVRLETRADAHAETIDSIRGQLRDLRASVQRGRG
jgi:hypothetical protein